MTVAKPMPQGKSKTADLDGPKYGESLLQKALRRLRQDRLTLTAMSIFALLVILAESAPLISTYILGTSAFEPDGFNAFLPLNTPGNILGTDELGRDMAARLLYAGRISLRIGIFGATIALSIGLVMGAITGYFGGIVDDIMNWVITTLDSVPAIYLLILISAVLSPSAQVLVIVISLIGWTGTTRLVRGQTIALRNQEFVLGARAIGASPFRVIFAHIVPNLISVVAISLANGIGGLILAESALSFLGLGVQPPQPTWGNMLTNAQRYYATPGANHLIWLPGILIFITVLCLYVIGDGVRDAFDPQSKK